ncbi:uncharacterized protein (TIGR02217 family) [Rhodobium orientis]|uniref:Glycoside hydrolase family 24 n=1 Tax=Rhodobium orientis TaxID=34017 RepID=A0A327JEI8_9HYPH|nr:DUF2460 domain-containing protein [Rhodobium orientis]MBB4305042.1 uncharacterized protein (TIGR02217 family) [Rhodobium orientis]MBK5949906.1 glycoside hydrolase family 24 [Rhodobium orientis]RAI24840.1 glycoside hydrolase family 24 [Rhodobium orientis]
MSDPAFHEVRFPTDLAFNSTGGPERQTEVVRLGSGREERNTRWAESRRRFDAGYGIRTLNDLHEVIVFFEERRGRLHGFRFRDPLDWKSCAPTATPAPTDCRIGTGDGDTRAFQLVKVYGSSSTKYTRSIAKPVAGTVRVAVDGAEKDEGADFALDAATGIVTFSSAETPAADAVIRAGFEFDVPVRFDTDRLEINLAAFEAGELPSVPLVEILP